jgi:Subtilase family
MVRNRQRLGLALRLAALASVSLAALPAAAGPVQPFYGNIKPFYGDIQPFYGNIKPFYGNLKPFYGNIKPFWGDMTPFWGSTGAFYGDLNSFWGTTNPVVGKGAPDYLTVGDFWTVTGGTWDQISNAWSAPTANYQAIAGQLQGLVDSSRTFWGAAVAAKSGGTFDTSFANPLLAKYGINLSDPNSLSKLDATARAMFFLDWYDGLMNYSGTDHVDHWMKTIDWTPAISLQQGGGQGTTVGILDMTVVGDATLQQNIVKASGVSTFTNGHGAAVASLIYGAHDGTGVMGIAPNSTVVAYNPFDSTGTANWSDITTGVQRLKAEGANVVNMSLGVPGTTFDQGWNGVFSSLSVTLTLKNTVFVMAAGNEGFVQNNNIAWSLLNPAFIVVGSVDVTGHISNFSNQPGTSCLTPALGICTGDKLMNHFIVAPGELIMVDDGHGGVVRESGTSFAAPQVTAAIALIQGRWPWLVNFPNETANIILNSAKDLGAPGVDPVYGHGLLDVGAAMSPLDFNKLVWYQVQNGHMTTLTSKAAMSAYQTQNHQAWDASGAYFTVFEPLGLLTQRDFNIPLSSKLVGQSVSALGGSQQMFQSYLLSRLNGWAGIPAKSGFAGQAYDGFAAVSVPVGSKWGPDMTLTIAPRDKRQGFQDEGPDYQSALKVQGERASLTFGFGDGAPALAAKSGFTQAADYDSERGGANPLLGLASGGGFAGWNYDLTHRLQISAGVMERSDSRDSMNLPGLARTGSGAATYQAGVELLGLSYAATDHVTLNGSYTHLHEASGLLGIQSLNPEDFRGGSTTDGFSLGANWAIGPHLSVMATGTLAHTRQGDSNQTLAVDANGLTSSSFEVGVQRTSLFTRGDRLQLSVSQPMFVDRGHLNLTSVQVIDRTTGDLGVVTQNIDISGQRQLAGEALYGLPISGGHGDVALFGRVETPPAAGQGQTYIAGARYRIRF